MASFKYDPLDLAEPSIRLLRLLKGDVDPIRCELFEVQFVERVCDTPYEALSYVWGSSELTHTIEVNGKELGITANLHVALSHLCPFQADRVLWVDAVCIDQNNHKERGHQVRQMGDIYRGARQFIVWLGEGTHETDTFMEVLQKIQANMESEGSPYRNWVPKDDSTSQRYWYRRWLEELRYAMCRRNPQQNEEHIHSVFDVHTMTSARKGLVEILNRSWFRRVWILQEVANAAAVVVHCGNTSICGLYFAVGQEILNFWDNASSCSGLSVEGQSRAVREIMPSRRSQDSWWNGREGRTMFSLLKRFGRSEATDKRDIIYALQGITTNCGLPVADYESTEGQLAKNVSRFIFRFDLTESARLDSISDLVAQLDWLLAASIERMSTYRSTDIFDLPNGGITEITPDALEIPSITGHWRLIEKFLCPATRCDIRFSHEAVLGIYRNCDSFVPNPGAMKLRCGTSYAEMIYAALQNPHEGPQIIDALWKAEEYRAPDHGVKALELLWGTEAPKDALHPGPVAVHSNCLAALMSRLIGSRRMLSPFDHFWKSQEDESLLGYAIKTHNTRLARMLLVLGADPSMKSTGWTPLMLLAMNPQNRCQETFLAMTTTTTSSIDFHAVVQGQTAMSLAKIHGNTEMIRLLSESPGFGARGLKRKYSA